MATYNVSSTKSYMQAMQPMIEKLNSLQLVIDQQQEDKLFKLPILKDGESKLDVGRNLHDLLKGFENVMDSTDLLMDDDDDEELDSSSHLGSFDESSDDDEADPLSKFELLVQVRDNCERIVKAGGGDKSLSNPVEDLFKNILNTLDSDIGEDALQTDLKTV
ncbi:unnamed protein product [Ambrosiozyma monospora]|uniref:Unnamed protein product n=1 Tax=Ambrosiozyma monospora TaxID=43982 RepID=A0ACB5U6I8_AMBMO|nr:unnamed protein product [Ambrosiozyma monospora]